MTPMIDMNGDLIASWTSKDQERVKRKLQKIRSMHGGLLSTTEADLYHAIHEIERLQAELDRYWSAINNALDIYDIERFRDSVKQEAHS